MGTEEMYLNKTNDTYDKVTANIISSAQSLSRVRLSDPMDCSKPGFPVHHQLPELTQPHVRSVGDAIQPSHPLPPSSPFAFSLSQLQGLFQWVSSYQQVAKVLELQHQTFQWVFRTDFLYGLVGSPCSPRDSQESSPAPQFKSINSLAFSFPYGPTLTSYMTTEKTITLNILTFVSKVISLLFNMLYVGQAHPTWHQTYFRNVVMEIVWS